MSEYDDIINHKPHVSPTHPPMPRIDRAAQFAPFAALTGYNDAINETRKLKDEKTALIEDSIREVNETLSCIRKNDDACIVYFDSDKKLYQSIEGKVSGIDSVNKAIQVGSHVISFDEIFTIKIN